MLLIVVDEAAFLAEANEHKRKLWDGDWLCRIYARRRAERDAGVGVGELPAHAA